MDLRRKSTDLLSLTRHSSRMIIVPLRLTTQYLHPRRPPHPPCTVPFSPGLSLHVSDIITDSRYATDIPSSPGATSSSSTFVPVYPQTAVPPPPSEASDDSFDAYTIPSWLFDDSEDSAEVAITLEEVLAEIDEPSPLPTGPGVIPDDWLFCNGKHVHKQSICRIVINLDFIHKSRNRPERVRGFIKPNWQPHLNTSAELIGPSTFVQGDHFLTLIRHRDMLSVALVRCTKIIRARSQESKLPVATIVNPEASVVLEGQIMTMRRVCLSTPLVSATLDYLRPIDHDLDPFSDPSPPLTTPHQESSHTSTSIPGNDTPWMWVWDGGFIMADSPMQGSEVVTEKAYIISAAGRFCSPQVDCHSVFAHN